MPTTVQITDTLIRDTITRAVQDVFKTMLALQAQFATDTLAAAAPHAPLLVAESGKPQVVGTVGFIGEINGLIYLHMSDEFARFITGKMLGMTPAELEASGEETVNDAIGEITNMTVGGFKNALCDYGFFCKLTIPSILRGSHFSIESVSSATRHVHAFDCSGHRLVTDILMKSGD